MQFSLVQDWRAPVEAKHKLGLSARIVMAPTSRAITSKDTGLMDADAARPLVQHMWRCTAKHWGVAAARQDWLIRSSTSAQSAARRLYYRLHEEDEAGGWGSACKAALGQMECHVPSCAALTTFA